MKFVLPLSMMLATGVWAQAPSQAQPADPAAAAAAGAKAALQTKPAAPGAPAQPAAPQVSLMSLPPATVVATVDGKAITAGDLQSIVQTLPPQNQQVALGNRRLLVEQYALARRLAAEAEKSKLDQSSPWRESIANMRMQVLANAAINQKFMALSSDPEEQKKYYDSNQQRFQQARVKAIYIPYTSAPNPPADASGKKPLSEADARAKAEELTRQIRAGADFVKLVKENSGDAASAAKDGDFGTIRRGDRLPEELKKTIFATKAGEVTGPVRQASGYYIFRVEEIGTQPFEQVQTEIGNALKDAKLQEWLQSLQKGLDIKMEGEAAAAPSPAPSAAPPPK